MKALKTIKPGACPDSETVVALVMEGAEETDALDLEGHLEGCEACRRLATEMRQTRDLLRLDHDLPTRDLTAEVMAKLPSAADWASDGMRPRHGILLHWRVALRIAAALAILLGTAHLSRLMRNRSEAGSPSPDPATLAVCAGRQWLLAQQLPSGGWDAATLGGRPEYTEALNGLAVMAIITADAPRTADTLAALNRAGEHLLAQQAGNGLFSRDENAAMYNHGIATLALLEIQHLTGDIRLIAPIDKALACICSRQSPAGGWGYRDDPASAPNTAITAWQVKALLQARAQGRDVPAAVLRKALNWMAGTVGPQGYFGYEGPQPPADNPAVLTMMGAYCLFAARDTDLMTDPRLEASIKIVVERLAQQTPDDYHQAYFLASVMEQLGTKAPTPAASAIQGILLARQTKAGADSGSWQIAGDRWGTTGGKLYSTSMAMLALAN